MAEQSIMEKMWQGTKYWGNWARNVAGGAYNTAANLTELPVQAASAAAQLIGGRKPSEIVVPHPLAKGRQAFQEMTGLPTEQPEPGFAVPFGFGRGAVLGPTPLGAMAGGISSAVSEEFVEDPLLKAAVEIAGPLAITSGVKGAAALRQGALRNIPKNGTDTIPMDIGRSRMNAKLIAEADYVSKNPKVADRVSKIVKANADKAEQTLKKFLNKNLDLSDATSGKRAIDAWDNFVSNKEKAFKVAAESKYKFLDEVGDRQIVDLKPVREALLKLYDDNYSPLNGPLGEAIAKDAQKRLAAIPSNGKATLKEVKNQLEKLGNVGYSNSDIVGIGSDTGASRFLHSAWKEALENTAAQGGDTPTKAAEYTKKLIEARKYYQEGITEINTLKDTALNTFFDVGKTGTRIDLQPEKVMSKLRAMKPAERAFFVNAIEKQDPGFIDILRQNKLQDIINKGTIQGVDARSPAFSYSDFLKAFDESKDDLKFLIPDVKQQVEFEKIVQDIRKAAQSTIVPHESHNAAISIGAGAASLATKAPGSQAITRGLGLQIGDWLSDKNALVDLLYGNRTNPQTAAGRWKELAKKVATGAYKPETAGMQLVNDFQANRALTGLSMMNPEQPQQPTNATETEQLPEPTEDVFDVESLPDPDESVFSTDEAQKKTSVNDNPAFEKLLDIVSKVESNNNPKAVSNKGAKGQFQFMPETAKAYGIDPMNPKQAREGARKYLKDLLNMFDGDLDSALAAYNWGPGNVKKYGLSKAPKETQDYLYKINNMLMEAD